MAEGYQQPTLLFTRTFQKNKSKKLNELRIENEFCDLIIKSEDGIEFEVHKIILSSASNYFHDLLTCPFREKYENCIPLPYITGDILEKILLFIYTNELNKNLEDIEKIITHAVIFQLEELVEICVGILSESISYNTCIKYWRLAKDNLIGYQFENLCLAYINTKAEYLFENLYLNDLSIEEMKFLLGENKLQCPEDKKFKYVWKWAEDKVFDGNTFSQVFMEIVDLLNFSKLKGEFLWKKFFGNEDLLENTELLKKIAKLISKEDNLENCDNKVNVNEKIPNRLIFSKKRLLGLGENKMFIGLGEKLTTIKEKELTSSFGHTIFETESNLLLLCGGGTSTCEYFNPSNLDWQKFPSMKRAKTAHECSYLGNKIYACGGYGSKSVEIFDLGKGEWYKGPDMLANNYNFGLSVLNRSLYAIGGPSKSVDVFDPRTSKWSFINRSLVSRKYEYLRSVPIGYYIYCFYYDKRFKYDTRMNRATDEIPCMDFDCYTNYCELDGCIYGFGYTKISDKYSLKLVQYNLDGQRGYTKSFGMYNVNDIGRPALVALYY